MYFHRVRERTLAVLLTLAGGVTSAHAAYTADMTAEEMISEINAAMAAGANCQDSMAEITAAVSANNGHAPDIVAALAARMDLPCYIEGWPIQRVEGRIEPPAGAGASVVYAQRSCAGAYHVVLAAVSGLDEVTETGFGSDEDTLTPKLYGILESANVAHGGDTALNSPCVNETLVGVFAALDGQGSQ